ncbi:prepilin peptidase [Novosphingobium sp.]|uniref:A24 family peptidase n=1 Tax=Novosphingobium sp. TaxID=1874826 RepID=UPI00286A7166|nr:prepilin peptidase [Novosphingobium sp.]
MGAAGFFGQPLGLAALALTGLFAAWSDLRYRRLPNWLCLLVAGAGLAQMLALGGMAGAGSALMHGALALAVGAGLFMLGGLGGGDAKYYAAVACWFPLGSAMQLLIAVALAGGALAIVWLALQRWHPKPADANDPDRAMLPFGVAIAAGALFAKSGVAV